MKGNAQGRKGQGGEGPCPDTWVGGGEKGQERAEEDVGRRAAGGLGCGEYLGHQGACRPDHRETCVLGSPLPPTLLDRRGDPNAA